MSDSPLPALVDPVRMLPAALLRALNHVLRQQAWARERLAMHAGKTVCIGLDGDPAASSAPIRLTAGIDAEGFLHAGDSDAEPAATLLVRRPVDSVFALLREGPTGVQRHLRVEGDVMLAATLGELAQHLRWDAEEDLSALIGDVAAHRVHGLVGASLGQLRALATRAGASVQQFVASGRAPVVDVDTTRSLGDELAALERRVRALEQRAERLSAAAAGS